MKIPTLAIDMDETLSKGFHTSWLNLYNKDYCDDLTENDITTWDIETIVKPECGRKIFDYLKTEGLFDRMVSPPLFSIETTKFLVKYFDVHIISSCIPESIFPKIEYLKKWFPHIDSDKFISCKHKHMIKADYMIDDYHENLRYFCGNKILINKPYNQNIDFEEDVIRVNNWVDIYQWFVGEIEEIKRNLQLSTINF